MAAIDALVCLNDIYASNSILSMLLHGNVYAREAAAKVLAVIGKGDLLAIRYLAIALQDTNSAVRNASADALISVSLGGDENF
jgi:HEAT repeat protein